MAALPLWSFSRVKCELQCVCRLLFWVYCKALTCGFMRNMHDVPLPSAPNCSVSGALQVGIQVFAGACPPYNKHRTASKRVQSVALRVALSLLQRFLPVIRRLRRKESRLWPK